VALLVVGVEGLEGAGDSHVQAAPADGRGVGEQGLADQLVGEGVAGRLVPGGRDQPGPLGLVEGVEQVAARVAGHPLDQVRLEHPAPDGGRDQRPPGGLGQPGQPLPDDHADTRGDVEVLDAQVAPEPALVVEEHPRLGQVQVALLGEERVALAVGVDAAHQGRRRPRSRRARTSRARPGRPRPPGAGRPAPARARRTGSGPARSLRRRRRAPTPPRTAASGRGTRAASRAPGPRTRTSRWPPDDRLVVAQHLVGHPVTVPGSELGWSTLDLQGPSFAEGPG
jgi:hypothetical protein